MTEQITAHKTTDGKIFEDEALAEAHESRLIAMREVGALLSCSGFPLHLNSFDVSDAVEFMVDNRDEFIRALQGHVSPVQAEDDADGERDALDISTLDPEDSAPEAVDTRGVCDPPDLVEDFRGVEIPRPTPTPEFATTAEAEQAGDFSPRADDDIPF